MIRKLQFADSINQNFESVGSIVNFICENLADTENDDSRVLIPLSVKTKMKNVLKVRDSKLKLKKLRG